MFAGSKKNYMFPFTNIYFSLIGTGTFIYIYICDAKYELAKPLYVGVAILYGNCQTPQYGGHFYIKAHKNPLCGGISGGVFAVGQYSCCLGHGTEPH